MLLIAVQLSGASLSICRFEIGINYRRDRFLILFQVAQHWGCYPAAFFGFLMEDIKPG
jgi:hypothetical protein